MLRRDRQSLISFYLKDFPVNIDYRGGLLLMRVESGQHGREEKNNATQTLIREEFTAAIPLGFADGGSTNPAARLNARRAEEASMELIPTDTNRTALYRDAHLELNYQTQAVQLDGSGVHLTRMEFSLLAQLARSAGEIVPRESLMLNVWGYEPGTQSRTMDVHLRRLRAKLGVYGRQHVETVFGLGYRLQPAMFPQILSHAAGA
jgi:DNA-binding winged helix-turn-helix (wHTH) protein